jgi:hypothetical protein
MDSKNISKKFSVIRPENAILGNYF